MYSHDDRLRAVQFDIKLGKRVGPIHRQLGEPHSNLIKIATSTGLLSK